MIGFIFLYMIAQVLIGIWASKKIKSEKDFLVAGRNIPSLLLVFSLFSTWFGAETIMGTSGEVYRHGLAGSRADPLGYSLCLLILGLLVAGKLWHKDYYTLGDFFRDRFGKKTEQLVILILFVSSLIWASAQIRAFGQIFSHYSQLPLWLTMTLGFGLVVIYSLLGGLLGDILTDFIQGIVLLLGLVILLVLVLSTVNFSESSPLVPPSQLSWTLPDESFWHRLERWTIPILGSLIAQESISRILSCRDKNQAKSVPLYAAAVYLVAGSIPVLLGLVGPKILPDLSDHEQFIIKMADSLLPHWALMMFIGALVSAILSTVDSILISGGGLISHNYLIPRLAIQRENHKLFLTRLSVITMASVAFVIALTSDGIYELVELASSWGSSGLVIVTLFGLWTSLGSSREANITLLVGVFSLVTFRELLNLTTPYLASLGLSAITFLILSHFFRSKRT
ncbi:MAG: hypothetical protein NZ480_04550 [Bdellovibrionaceae bacterium]|nr:hypothetical protein [Pseudobdellovibrionaceae bacterium]MDW8189790.1 hypothetical protein [Pseudobdellovibrionaceae bacterium]